MSTAVSPTRESTVPPFRRQPPPMLIRCLFGFWIYAIFAPLMWVFERMGRGDRLLTSRGTRRRKRLEEKNPFRGYVATKHDVFVATYAKSGTNWMMQIAHQLLFHGKGEFDHIHSVVPWPDTKAMGPMSKYAIPVEDDSVWKASPEQKRVIKTHFDWSLLPYSEDARYIAVIRDPKDIFVSNYHFIRQVLGPAMPSVDTWFRLFLSDNFVLGGSWAVNAAGYWAERHRPNVLVVSFKAMKRDLAGTVRRVAEFLDVHPSEDILAEVCEKSSFAYMKRNDDKFCMWQINPWGKPVEMVRKGTQGGSSELLTPTQQREMDAYFTAELKRLGSDLPYEQFCDLTK
ncbi:MAG: sulfotransferase domain-containing protein [Acidobacteriia bacterium]|nr:sulfotransferase domain-containing protein [Terriglobia bacterium]